jgi:hypothetical protein
MHAYSIHRQLNGDGVRWIVWDEDEATPLATGAADSEQEALVAIRAAMKASSKHHLESGAAL